MEELKEIRVNGTDILLENNRVKGSILPEKIAELNRNIICKGNTIIEGPIFGQRIEVRNGDLEVQGAVFAELELYVDTSATGVIKFLKSVGSADSVTSRANNCKCIFYSDVNAKKVTLYNSFVAGSIYADEITLDNCVVIGGVFATQRLVVTNSIVGTFNTPEISVDGNLSLLLPSAFSVEPMVKTADAKLFNLSLADLGALYRGVPQSPESGKIELNTDIDEIKTSLANDEIQKTLRSYTVIGKVLAADLIDTDKFQNHFLLTAAALGSQLLKTYNLGTDKDGNLAELTLEKICDFFFDILNGKIEIQMMDGTFNISQITGTKY